MCITSNVYFAHLVCKGKTMLGFPILGVGDRSVSIQFKLCYIMSKSDKAGSVQARRIYLPTWSPPCKMVVVKLFRSL